MKKLFNLKKLFFYFTFFLFAICKINAQSFQIVHAEYFVNGITSQNHLEHKIKINYKKNFNTEDELKTYLSFLKNQYTNLRIFDDIQIEYLLMPQSQDDTKSEHGLSANADANTSAKSDSQDKTQTESTLQTETNSKTKQHATAVILQIKVIDSKNFIVLPYYKYDSNDGNTFKIKMKDSNFCGTVNSLESDIYFSLLQKKKIKQILSLAELLITICLFTLV